MSYARFVPQEQGFICGLLKLSVVVAAAGSELGLIVGETNFVCVQCSTRRSKLCVKWSLLCGANTLYVKCSSHSPHLLLLSLVHFLLFHLHRNKSANARTHLTKKRSQKQHCQQLVVSFAFLHFLLNNKQKSEIFEQQ